MKLALLILTCLPSILFAQQGNYDRDEIEALILAHDYTQCRNLCVELLEDDPNDCFLIQAHATVLYYLSEYEAAEQVLTEFTGLKEARPVDQGAYYQIYALLSIHQNKLQFADSLLNLGESILLEVNDVPVELSDLYGAWGELKWQMGQPFESLSKVQKSEAIARNANDNKRLSRIYNNLGIISWELQRFGEALDYLNLSLELKQQIHGFDHESIAQMFNNIGVVYYHSGDQDKALEYYTIAYDKWMAVDPMHKKLPLALNNLGRILADEGKFHEAIELYERSEEIVVLKRGSFTPELTEVLELQANSWMGIGNDEQAILILNRALTLQQEFEQPNNSRLVHLYHSLANAYKGRGQSEIVLDYLDIATKVMVTAGQERSPALSEVLVTRSQYYHDEGDLEQAKVVAKEAIEVFAIDEGEELDPSRYWAHKSLVPAILNLVDLLDPLTESADVGACLALCMDILDRLKKQTDSYESRKLLSNLAPDIYGRMLSFQMTQDAPEADLFETIERSKAFSLKLHQQENYASRISGVDDDLLRQEDQLRSRRDYWDRAVRRARENGQEHLDATNQLALMNLSLDSLTDIIAERYPSYYNLRYNTETVSLDNLQLWLQDDQVYITYLQSGDVIYVLLITRETTQIFETDANQCRSRVEAFVRSTSDHDFILENRQESDELFSESAYGLYEQLLARGHSILDGSQQLIISPSGMLSAINFGLLIQEKQDEDFSYRDLPYLIRDYTISYSWSVNHLLEQAESEQTQLGIWGKHTHEQGNLALKEVDRLASISGTSPYLDELCTESSFKKLAHRYRFLHVATHGLLDKDPEDFHLLFHPDSANDGQLFLSELYSLNLDAELVTLSACETGSGEWVNGESTNSLASGFAYAGCPSILMSLWQVNDQSTSELMVEFYGNLFEGKNKAAALREAQMNYLEKLEDPLYTHPYFWGGFVLLGDASIGGTDHNFWWWSGLAVMGILILAAARLFRRRQQL